MARLAQNSGSASPASMAPRTASITALSTIAANVWREFGACPLAFAEYLLIGVAGLLFPDDLLNDEGVNRAASGAGTKPGPPGGPPCDPGP